MSPIEINDTEGVKNISEILNSPQEPSEFIKLTFRKLKQGNMVKGGTNEPPKGDRPPTPPAQPK